MTWKALRHPNILTLLGVVMTGDRFAMVSEWMTNGDIKRFVAIHPHENRFELVSSPLECLTPSIVVDDCATPIVGRRNEGLGLYAQSGNDPRRSQRGMSSSPGSLSPSDGFRT